MNLRFWVQALSLLAAFLAACHTPSKPQTDRPRFEPAGDTFPVAVPPSYDSVTGWLVTAEDHSDLNSPDIRLPVAIIKARNPAGQAPVVYLSGGPGTSAMNTAAYPGAYPWLEDRDFIVFGQRGTHFAKPALMCPELRLAVETGGDDVAALRACKSRFIEDSIDPSQYNSRASARDIEDLRTALGLDDINLYGVSYGTRLALEYARSFSQNLSSMVLDAPLPPNAIYDDESAANFEDVLRRIARDCAAQPACNTAYPDLEGRFFAALNSPPLGMTGAELALLIDIGGAEAIAAAPSHMDAVAKFDTDLLAEKPGTDTLSDFAWGMRLSVWCSEAWPHSRRSQSDMPGPALGGLESAAFDPAWCPVWNVPPLDNGSIAPVASDVPTLIIAGEFDPSTPPSWGKLAAETLSRSRLIVIRGGSHSSTQNWGGDGCAMKLAAAFIDAPEAFIQDEDSASCLAKTAMPVYVVPE